MRSASFRNNSKCLCFTRGKCIITTGLLDGLLNDEEIAFVLAHEISHQIKEHNEKNIRKYLQLRQSLGEYGGNISNNVFKFLTVPLSVIDEYEADQGSIWLMSMAGFDPEKGIQVLDRWTQIENHFDSSSFFSTHPPSYKRYACCAVLISQAKVR
ncbi:MAG: M48 family metallopeptidase [Saprospiraceae bacterium]|nr:M48 family metallopeptidase [Saprospiraceae bacterium]